MKYASGIVLNFIYSSSNSKHTFTFGKFRTLNSIKMIEIPYELCTAHYLGGYSSTKQLHAAAIKAEDPDDGKCWKL